MKITEDTTLAELQACLEAQGNPFVTMMKGHPGALYARNVILYTQDLGMFHGGGATVAEALEAALTDLGMFHREQIRAAVLAGDPYVREQTARVLSMLTPREREALAGDPYEPGVSLREQTARVLSTLTPREREVLDQRLIAKPVDRDPAFNKFRQTSDEVCHGCGHTRDEHPNDSGCQQWHDRPWAREEDSK